MFIMKALYSSMRLVGIRGAYSFSSQTKKKNSEWIYSSSHEEMQHKKEGRIWVYSHLHHDTHNSSLRLVDALQQSDIILTSHIRLSRQFMKAITNNIRYTQPQSQPQQRNKNTPIEYDAQSKQIEQLKSTDDVRTQQYNTQMQISKYIQLKNEVNKDESTLQRINPNEINKIKEFIQLKSFKAKLLQLKHNHGYAPIFNIQSQMHNIKDWQQDGINITCLFTQSHIQECGQTIRYLQQHKLPYEIMPNSDILITAIVSSGIPADRFSIQYHPPSFTQLFMRRKSMKITTCIAINSQRLDRLVSKICEIFGKQQLIYIHGQRKHFRGQAYKAIQFINQNITQETMSYVIVSPYIAQFNEEIKDQINRKEHIIGQLTSGKLNIVEMEYLSKKLQQLKRKQHVYEVDAYMMTAQLLSKTKDQELVHSFLKRVFPLKKQQTLRTYIEQGRSRVVIDHLQL